MLKLRREIETMPRDCLFLDERSLIVRTHQFHITINQAKILKVMRMLF